MKYHGPVTAFQSHMEPYPQQVTMPCASAPSSALRDQMAHPGSGRYRRTTGHALLTKRAPPTIPDIERAVSAALPRPPTFQALSLPYAASAAHAGRATHDVPPSAAHPTHYARAGESCRTPIRPCSVTPDPAPAAGTEHARLMTSFTASTRIRHATPGRRDDHDAAPHRTLHLPPAPDTTRSRRAPQPTHTSVPPRPHQGAATDVSPRRSATSATASAASPTPHPWRALCQHTHPQRHARTRARDES